MPYNYGSPYSGYSRSGHSKRPHYRRWKRKYYPKAGKIMWKIAKQAVKAVTNVEFKVKDVNTTAAISNNGAVHLLNPVAQGIERNMRDGDNYKIVKIQGKGTLKMHESAVNTMVKLALVLLGPNNNVDSFAWGQVYLNEDIISYRLLDRTKDYRVLWSRVYTLSQGEGKSELIWNINKKMEIKVRCDDGVTNPRTNGLYWMTLSDEATNTVAQNTKFRIRYLDN